MNRMKTLIAGALTAAFLSVCVVVLTPAKAEEPVLKGSVSTPSGVPAKSYPVIIDGTTALGEHYNTFVTTDEKGAFKVKRLPPGTYTAVPAGQPESGVKVTIQKIPWYDLWATQETKDVGNLSVDIGQKLRPQ